MADQSGGEGWWQASDQKWYAPEQGAEPAPMAPPPMPTTDEPPGPGYWRASDGQWYPPESQPGTAAGVMRQGAVPGAYDMFVLPPGSQLSSRWKRFGNFLLGIVLIVVTLGIGYVIWAFIVYGRGQTPAKHLLNMYVVDERTGRPATWGVMFLRGWIIDGLLNQITAGIFFIVSALWIFGGDKHQRLTDKMVHTLVVDAPSGLAG